MIAASAAHAAPADLGDPALLTIKKAANALRAKQVTALDLTEACLRRIEKIEPSVNSFITVLGEQARQRAKEIAEEQRRGKWLGPLHGIPIAVKDNIDTAGVRTTAASGVYKDRVPSADATVVGKLKAAGAVILGKTNLHEFAYGGTSDESYFGAVHNPWNLDHIAGGRRVARPPQYPPTFVSQRWAPIRQGRSAFLRLTVEPLDSSQVMGE